jgi:hypothetical protein
LIPHAIRLEERIVLTTTVTPEEQLFVYLLNLARNNPAAYQHAQNLSVDLSGVAPQPPLAVNNELFASAQFHATEMATYNYFAHQSQVTGEWPNQMVRDQGYPLPMTAPAGGNSFYTLANNSNQVESIAAGTSTAQDTLNLLLVDAGENPPAHRIQLLAMDAFFQLDREIGVGQAYNASSTYGNYWAIHTAFVDPSNEFLTGVVFNDQNNTGRYGLNEGLAGVTITVGNLHTTTNAAGGWSLPITNGQYVVTASGGAFTGTSSVPVTVSGSNVEVDFASGLSTGYVNFVKVSSPGLTSTSITSSANPSVSGQSVTFTATVSPSAATGTVAFMDGSVVLGMASISGGVATYSTSSLGVGSHSITASYTPAAGSPWTGSGSMVLVEQINQTPPTSDPPDNFDGQGKTDLAVFRSSNDIWIVRYSDGSTHVFQMGSPSQNCIPVPGDYQGIGKTDLAVFVPSVDYWIVRYQDGSAHVFQMGDPKQGDIPVPGDYEGNGKTDLAVFRPSSDDWIVRYQDGSVHIFQMGDPMAGDIPVPGDYEGNGKTDLAVFRPSSDDWIVRYQDGSVHIFQMGDPKQDDIPVPGDYQGIGKTDLAVFRPASDIWIIRYQDGSVHLYQMGDHTQGDLPAGMPAAYQTQLATSAVADAYPSSVPAFTRLAAHGTRSNLAAPAWSVSTAARRILGAGVVKRFAFGL